tara:strand:+ start:211 stop:486 length:276 start_codon:yes stop_codon:yes gene_type:complete
VIVITFYFLSSYLIYSFDILKQLIPILLKSLSGEAEYIDDDIVILEWIFFTEITIIFAIPEAACAHMESTITFLQNYHVGSKLQILINFLE